MDGLPTTTASINLPTPAPAQIALALVVLRTKPAHLSIEDYLAQLSDHIKPESALQTDLHLDSQSFWKHAYEKREKEITRLQNRIFELEAQSTTVDDESSPWHRLDGLKRKAEAQTMTGVKANTQSKRRRMTDIKPKDCTATIHPLEQNGGIAEEMKSILRQQYALHSAMSSKASRAALAGHVECISASVITALKAAVRCSNHTQHQLETKIDVCSLADRFSIFYQSLLLAVENAPTPDDSATCRAHIVRLCEHLLVQIHEAARCETLRVEEEETQLLKIPKSNWRLTKTTKAAFEERREDHNRKLKALTSMISQAFRNLDVSLATHRLLLEWLIYDLLEHVSKTLALMVFGSSRSETNLTKLPLPQEFIHATAQDQEREIRTAQLKGWCLVAGLKAATDMVNIAADYADARGTLSDLQGRLQDILLFSVFGDDVDTFKHAMKNASLAKKDVDAGIEEILTEDADERQKQTWYVGQVWQILGWDTLTPGGSGTEKERTRKARIVTELTQAIDQQGS